MAEPTTPTEPETPVEAPVKEDIEKIIEKTAQSAADRVRTEYSNKLKAAQEEIENLHKEKMSAKERADYEATKLKEELEKKSHDLTRREQELLATETLVKEGLDVEFLPYVLGSDKDSTLGKISTLKAVFNKALDSKIDTKLKGQARDPTKGRASETSGIEGMTPAEIKAKSKSDRDWFATNEAAIMKKLSEGGFKRQ